MKSVGWMVNLSMRRVEPVVSKHSNLNRDTYGLYQGPKRTYMLHDAQVFDTELEALRRLHDRMTERHTQLCDQLDKYRTELLSVRGAFERLERRPKPTESGASE